MNFLNSFILVAVVILKLAENKKLVATNQCSTTKKESNSDSSPSKYARNNETSLVKDNRYRNTDEYSKGRKPDQVENEPRNEERTSRQRGKMKVGLEEEKIKYGMRDVSKNILGRRSDIKIKDKGVTEMRLKKREDITSIPILVSRKEKSLISVTPNKAVGNKKINKLEIGESSKNSDFGNRNLSKEKIWLGEKNKVSLEDTMDHDKIDIEKQKHKTAMREKPLYSNSLRKQHQAMSGPTSRNKENLCVGKELKCNEINTELSRQYGRTHTKDKAAAVGSAEKTIPTNSISSTQSSGNRNLGIESSSNPLVRSINERRRTNEELLLSLRQIYGSEKSSIHEEFGGVSTSSRRPNHLAGTSRDNKHRHKSNNTDEIIEKTRENSGLGIKSNQANKSNSRRNGDCSSRNPPAYDQRLEVSGLRHQTHRRQTNSTRNNDSKKKLMVDEPAITSKSSTSRQNNSIVEKYRQLVDENPTGHASASSNIPAGNITEPTPVPLLIREIEYMQRSLEEFHRGLMRPNNHEQLANSRPSHLSSHEQFANARPSHLSSHEQLVNARPSHLPSYEQLVNARPSHFPRYEQLVNARPSHLPSYDQLVNARPSHLSSHEQLVNARPSHLPSHEQLVNARPSHLSSHEQLVNARPSHLLSHEQLVNARPSRPSSHEHSVNARPSHHPPFVHQYEIQPDLWPYPNINHGGTEGFQNNAELNTRTQYINPLYDGSKESNSSVFEERKNHFREYLRRKNTKFFHHIYLRRGLLLEDSCYSVMSVPTSAVLKGHLMVHHEGETGFDMGGITQNWLDDLSKIMVDPSYGLFRYTPKYEIEINPFSGKLNPLHLSSFECYGRITGVALFHNRLLDVSFARSFFKSMLGMNMTLDDVKQQDPEYYRSLKYVLDINYDITDMELTFILEESYMGELHQYDLIPNGYRKAVINDDIKNRKLYVNKLINMKYIDRTKEQMNAFVKGFSSIIDASLLTLFSIEEWQTLLAGNPKIDVEDWKRHTNYMGYSAYSFPVTFFWKFIEESNQTVRSQVLKFVTGSSRVPIAGFKDLYGIDKPQKFTISFAPYLTPESLPRGHTCENKLDLPPYDNQHKLKTKFIQAITMADGFSEFLL